jgi:2,4-dienoyl-CoA reductase-like NADH-dependent reductase (Old Yellow Enzyme family)/thioredoxin reductase
MEFKKLFEPIVINGMEVRNRIVMPPMHTRFASERGETTDQIVEYLAERAKGGVGLIILENTCVDWAFGRAAGNPIRIDDDIFTSGLHDIAEAVHEYGAKIATQPQHTGRQNTVPNIEGRKSPIAPSAIPCKVCKDVPTEMTIEVIKQVIQQFVDAARRTKEAGFDALELHAAHGYMFTQFMSPYTNKRNDMYGGSLENRMRFPAEVVRRVRAEVGPDFPIIFRFSAEDKIPDGLKLEDSLYLVRLLEKEGVDAFHVSAGIYETITWIYPDEPGVLVHLAAAVKKEVKVPVITVGRLGNPENAEKVLREGKADMVSMGRALLADSYIAVKAKSGRAEDIRPCIACNECVGRLFEGWRIACTVNPLMSKEYKKRIVRTRSPKRVTVVGAGPAGLEAARVAALIGHEVKVFEKRDKIGGQMNEASVASFKESHLRPLITYYETQLKKLKVEVSLGREIGVNDIVVQKPDAVIVAAGSIPKIPDIRGIDKSHVHLAVDVLASEGGILDKGQKGKEVRIEKGKEVCVIGGGEVGLEVACVLDEKGCRVTVVEITDEIVKDLNELQLEYMDERLAKREITVLRNHCVREIKDKNVSVENNKFEIREMKADVVLIAIGFTPNNALSQQLEGKAPIVKGVGDCCGIGRLYAAIHGGFDAALQLDGFIEV